MNYIVRSFHERGIKPTNTTSHKTEQLISVGNPPHVYELVWVKLVNGILTLPTW